MTFKVAAIPSRIKIGESIQEQSAFIALALASTLLNPVTDFAGTDGKMKPFTRGNLCVTTFLESRLSSGRLARR